MTLQNRLRIAAEVRAVAAKQQIKQAEIAAVLNISTAGVSRRMRGSQSFTAEEMFALASFFDVAIGVLYGESDGLQAPAEPVPYGAGSPGAFLRADAAA